MLPSSGSARYACDRVEVAIPDRIDQLLVEHPDGVGQRQRGVLLDDKAAGPLGQGRRVARIEHRAPCLVGQAVADRLDELVVREDPALGQHQLALDRRDDIDLEDPPNALLEHRAVRVGGHIGDHGGLKLFAAHRRRRLGAGVDALVVGGEGQLLDLAAIEADKGVLFLGRRLVAQLLLGDRLELASDPRHGLKPLLVLLGQ